MIHRTFSYPLSELNLKEELRAIQNITIEMNLSVDSIQKLIRIKQMIYPEIKYKETEICNHFLL